MLEVTPVVDVRKLRWGGRGCLWAAMLPVAGLATGVAAWLV